MRTQTSRLALWTGILLMACTQALAVTVTNNSIADTYIEDGDTSANGLLTSMPIKNDGAGGERWAFVKWDVSNIPSEVAIIDATFRILQVDNGVGDGVDVYAINNGDWGEYTLTWNTWENLTTSNTFLGTMTPITPWNAGGICTFSGSSLTALVRDWRDGDQDNYGLLLKWHHDTLWGQDTYIPREHPMDDPMLIINYGEIPPYGSVITNDAVADTEIDQHVNYMNSNFGTAGSIKVETRSTADTDPVVSPQSWGLFKWDLTGLDSGTVVDGVTFRVIQVDSVVETVDIYGIIAGDWDESTVTWNNWVGTETLQLLGTMTDVSYPAGITTFSNAALADWVQDWIDGDRDNLGIVVKWSGSVGQSDNFVAKEHASQDAPRLIVTTKRPSRCSLILYQ